MLTSSFCHSYRIPYRGNSVATAIAKRHFDRAVKLRKIAEPDSLHYFDDILKIFSINSMTDTLKLTILLCLMCDPGQSLSLFMLPFKDLKSGQRNCGIRLFSGLTLTRATEGSMDYDDRFIQRQRRSLQNPTTVSVNNGISRSTPTPRISTGRLPTAAIKQRVKERSSNRQPPTRNYSLLDHEILSKEEEQRLGRMLRRAIEVKERIKDLIEAKQKQRLEQYQSQRNTMPNIGDINDDNDDDDDEVSLSLEAELEEFLKRKKRLGHYIKDYGYNYNQMEDEESLGLSLYGIDHIDMLEHYDSKSIILKGSESLDIASIPLTNREIMEELGIEGGRKEIAQILVDGARAKGKLIESNVRLVMNISKKWLNRSTSNSGIGQNNRSIYGSSTRPSLDEVVQEGIMGLAQAIERFEPDRGLKLSTYATFYITNKVRKCFQSATTGCLKVSPGYYPMRIKYQKLVKDHFFKTGKSLDMDVAAENLGLRLDRLIFILRMTEPLVELDGVGVSTIGNFANGSGGGAGSNIQGYESLPTLADTLQW
jgi:DNA-directed RNA polymerase sigma subunit (sigma70/sigma32)